MKERLSTAVRGRLAVAVVLLGIIAAACGGEGGDGLSAEAQQGLEISRSNGCAACHGNDGEGSVGPAWVGLAGSDVELADGTTVTADAAYLRRAITDPQADRVAGYDIQMPGNGLTPEQVDAVIAYIEALG